MSRKGSALIGVFLIATGFGLDRGFSCRDGKFLVTTGFGLGERIFMSRRRI